MTEREKGPGPTLPESVWCYTSRAGDGAMLVALRTEAEAKDEQRVDNECGRYWLSPIVRYVRADLAPDPEREKLVETIRALVTSEDDGPEGAMGARWILGQVRAALEAHDAKGER